MHRESRSPKYGYQGLFILMVVGLLLISFFYGHLFIPIFANIFFTLVFFIAVYSLSERRVFLVITLTLATISVTTTWLYFKFQNSNALIVDAAADVIFFGYLATLISMKVFKHKEVDSETIFGALCVYFLLAFFWGFIYYLMDLVDPNSFVLVTRHKGDVSGYIYFSLVTLSTLGYGDIVPLTPSSRALACLEAVFGQLYLAVVVARFVGIEISNRTLKVRTKGD